MSECHCGQPSVAPCPCCERSVCAEHLSQAANALAEAIFGERKN